MIHFYGITIILLPFGKGSTLNGKNWLPIGANSFLLELTPFRKEFFVQESKLEATKAHSLVKMTDNLPGASSPLRSSPWQKGIQEM